jgi:tRNA(Arg) A34 adenosine deaminase TadA
MTTTKDTKFASRAAEEAQRSPCQMRHGCVAVINGRIVGRGYNNYRSYSKDGFIHDCMTCHAEMAALREVYRYFKLRGDFRQRLKGDQQPKVSKDNFVRNPRQSSWGTPRVGTVC